MKVLCLHELVEIYAQQIKNQANVLSKEQEVPNSYLAGPVIWVVVPNVLENFDLDQALVVKLLLISYNLKSAHALFLVVIDLQNLESGYFHR